MYTDSTSLQYLRFMVDSAEYGIDILDVREIRRNDRPTQLAGASAEVAGIIDLRGEIVPIVDLRMALGRERGASDVCIIVNVGGRCVGLAVDRVCEVVRIAGSEVKPLPLEDGQSLVRGVAAGADEHLTLLLDVPQLLARVARAA